MGGHVVRSLELRKRPQKVTRALVAVGVLGQVLLVVRLGVPPGRCGKDLGRDGLALVPLLLDLECDLARGLFLLGGVEEDAGAVLGAPVGALLV